MTHNVAIKDGTGTFVFKGEMFPGIATQDYEVRRWRPGPTPSTARCTRT